jgi:arabinose-5-phosphate isomerase
MERQDDFLSVQVGAIMTRTPCTTNPDQLAAAAVGLMERYGVMALPVLDQQRRVLGIVHLHDLMRARAV